MRRLVAQLQVALQHSLMHENKTGAHDLRTSWTNYLWTSSQSVHCRQILQQMATKRHGTLEASQCSADITSGSSFCRKTSTVEQWNNALLMSKQTGPASAAHDRGCCTACSSISVGHQKSSHFGRSLDWRCLPALPLDHVGLYATNMLSD